MSDYKVPERASDAFNARIAAGAPYDAAIDGAIAAACRVAVAEELRRLAAERMASFETYRACCSIPISHCRLCSTREHAACRPLSTSVPAPTPSTRKGQRDERDG